jgi:lipopolysaccharide biosynthesis regulator YciM
MLIVLDEILADIKSNLADEQLLQKYRLSWPQLTKVYSRLLHFGHITQDDLARRLTMRSGQDGSHIPVAHIDPPEKNYRCNECDFRSRAHFSACPRCNSVNLRRLTRARCQALAMARLRGAGSNG